MVFLLGALSQSCNKQSRKGTTPKAEKKKEKKKNPRDYFKFDKKGKVKTKSKNAEKTFSFPDIKVGFIFVAPQLDVLPMLSVELYEFEKVPFYFDFGLSTHLLYVSLGYNIIPIYEVGVFVWVGYHFIDRNKEFWGVNFRGLCFGLGATVIKF